jgi:hypothetical protein
MKHKFWVVHVGAKTIYVMKYRDQKLTKVDLYDGNSMNDDTYIKDYRAGRLESSRATMIESTDDLFSHPLFAFLGILVQ